MKDNRFTTSNANTPPPGGDVETRIWLNRRKTETIDQECAQLSVIALLAPLLPEPYASGVRALVEKAEASSDMTELTVAMNELTTEFRGRKDLLVAGQNSEISKIFAALPEKERPNMPSFAGRLIGPEGYAVFNFLYQTRAEREFLGKPTDLSVIEMARKLWGGKGTAGRAKMLAYAHFAQYFGLIEIKREGSGPTATLMLRITDTGLEWFFHYRRKAAVISAPFESRIDECRSAAAEAALGAAAKSDGKDRPWKRASLLVCGLAVIFGLSLSAPQTLAGDNRSDMYPTMPLHPVAVPIVAGLQNDTQGKWAAGAAFRIADDQLTDPSRRAGETRPLDKTVAGFFDLTDRQMPGSGQGPAGPRPWQVAVTDPSQRAGETYPI